MEKETKTSGSSSAQTVLNVLLVIICCAILGLFIRDYLKKTDELSKYRESERQWKESTVAKKRTAAALAEIYKTTTIDKTDLDAAEANGIITPEERKKIQEDIANHVSENLSPIC